MKYIFTVLIIFVLLTSPFTLQAANSPAPVPNPRFEDNGDQTITDKTTGLIWSKDRNPAVSAITWKQALDYITTLNSSNYLGYNDWRLPNLNELNSLVKFHQSGNSTYRAHDHLDFAGFTNFDFDEFWTSTTDVSNPNGAWYIDFIDGINRSYSKNSNKAAWPVRGKRSDTATILMTGQTTCYSESGTVIACSGTGQDGELQKGSEWPNPRFEDNGDQTITDKTTGLIWSKKETLRSGTLSNKISALNNENYLGHNDWRIPDWNELISLFNYQETSPNWLNSQGFTITDLSSYRTFFEVFLNTVNYTNKYFRACYDCSGGWDPAAIQGYYTVLPVRGGKHDLFVTTFGTGKGAVSSNFGNILLEMAPFYTPYQPFQSIEIVNFGSSSYAHGTSVTLTAIPNEDSSFVSWSGCNSTIGTNCNVLVNNLSRVYVTFNSNVVNGTCGSANGTTVSSKPTTNLCGDASIPTVNGDGPWNWTCTGSNGGTSASCNASVANSTPTQYTVTPTTGTGFTFSPSTPQTITNNATTSFTVTLATGYNIASVTGCGGSLNGTTYTTGPITANCSITGIAVARTTLNGLSITSGATTVSEGGSATYGATAYWSDSTTTTVNPIWSITPTTYASIDANTGVLKTLAVTSDQVVTVSANYTSGGVTRTATKTVTLTDETFTVRLGVNKSISTMNWHEASSEVPAPSNLGTLSPDLIEYTSDISSSHVRVNTSAAYKPQCADAESGNAKASLGASISVEGTAGSSSLAEITFNYTVNGSVELNGGGTSHVTIAGTNSPDVFDEIKCSTFDQPAPITCSKNLSGNRSKTVTMPLRSGESRNIGLYLYAHSDTCGISSSTLLNANISSIDIVFSNSGVCGTAHGTTVYTKPASNLCADGSLPDVTGTGPWSWTCAGNNGSSSSLCSTTPSNETIDQQNILDWNGGAVNIAPYNNVQQTFIPTMIHLSAVAVGLMTGNSGKGGDQVSIKILDSNKHAVAEVTDTIPEGFDGLWNFKIPNNGIAVVPGQIYTIQLADTGKIVFFWKYNTNNSYVRGQAYFYGSSFGTNDFIFYAYSSQAVPPINGICGSTHGTTVSSKPTTNLCSDSSSPKVTGTGPWSWTCSGSNGGTTATCNASITTTPVTQFTITPTSGSGFSVNPATPQTVINSATTSFTVTPSSGYGIASVSGCGGGLSGTTYTTGAITANCLITVNAVARNASNGTIPTIADALKVLQAVVGTKPLTPDEKIRYDVAPLGNTGSPVGNGAIDIADVLLILRRSIGIGSW